MPTRSKFQNVQLSKQSNYTKQSNTQDVSEGLDDTIIFIIDDEGSPVLGLQSVSQLPFTAPIL